MYEHGEIYFLDFSIRKANLVFISQAKQLVRYAAKDKTLLEGKRQLSFNLTGCGKIAWRGVILSLLNY